MLLWFFIQNKKLRLAHSLVSKVVVTNCYNHGSLKQQTFILSVLEARNPKSSGPQGHTSPENFTGTFALGFS